MTNPPLKDTLLGRTLDLDKTNRWRLVKNLGGGVTSRVYLAVRSLEAGQVELARFQEAGFPESLPPGSLAALKIGDLDWSPGLQTNFKRESDLLLDMEEVERVWDTHYFPRMIFPREKGAEIIQHPWEEREVKGKKQQVQRNLAVLVMELVQGQPVDRIITSQENSRLDERTALAIALQYADMLTQLHSKNKTCADRKFTDLYWLAGSGASGGQLTVLDWNVFEEGSLGRELDLFRFGIFFFQMLLGAEPAFRVSKEEGEEWHLVGRLRDQPGWGDLSLGTQTILRKVLHPRRESRYRAAQDLKSDLNRAWQLWNMKTADLVNAARETHGADVSYRFTAAWLARRKKDQDPGYSLPNDFNDLYSRLDNETKGDVENALVKIRSRFNNGRFDTGPVDPTTLEQDARAALQQASYEPELAIRAVRYLLLVKAYTRAKTVVGNPSARQERTALANIADGLDNPADLPDFKREMDQLRLKPGFGEAMKEFGEEVDLRWKAAEGRRLANQGEYYAGAGQLGEAISQWGSLPAELRHYLATFEKDLQEDARAFRDLAGEQETPTDLLMLGCQHLAADRLKDALAAMKRGARANPRRKDLQTALALAQTLDRYQEMKNAGLMEMQLFYMVELQKIPLEPLETACKTAGEPPYSERKAAMAAALKECLEIPQHELSKVQLGLVNRAVLLPEAPDQVSELAGDIADYLDIFGNVDHDFVPFLRKKLGEFRDQAQQALLPENLPPAEQDPTLLWNQLPVRPDQLEAKIRHLNDQREKLARVVHLLTAIRDSLGTLPSALADLPFDYKERCLPRLDRQIAALEGWANLFSSLRKRFVMALEAHDMDEEKEILDETKKRDIRLYTHPSLARETLEEINRRRRAALEKIDLAQSHFLNVNKLLQAENDTGALGELLLAKTLAGEASDLFSSAFAVVQDTGLSELEDRTILVSLKKALNAQSEFIRAFQQKIMDFAESRFYRASAEYWDHAGQVETRGRATEELEHAHSWAEFLSEASADRARAEIEKMEARLSELSSQNSRKAYTMAVFWLGQAEKVLKPGEEVPEVALEALLTAHNYLEELDNEQRSVLVGQHAGLMTRAEKSMLAHRKDRLSHFIQKVDQDLAAARKLAKEQCYATCRQYDLILSFMPEAIGRLSAVSRQVLAEYRESHQKALERKHEIDLLWPILANPPRDFKKVEEMIADARLYDPDWEDLHELELNLEERKKELLAAFELLSDAFAQALAGRQVCRAREFLTQMEALTPSMPGWKQEIETCRDMLNHQEAKEKLDNRRTQARKQLGISKEYWNYLPGRLNPQTVDYDLKAIQTQLDEEERSLLTLFDESNIDNDLKTEIKNLANLMWRAFETITNYKVDMAHPVVRKLGVFAETLEQISIINQPQAVPSVEPAHSKPAQSQPFQPQPAQAKPTQSHQVQSQPAQSAVAYYSAGSSVDKSAPKKEAQAPGSEPTVPDPRRKSDTD